MHQQGIPVRGILEESSREQWRAGVLDVASVRKKSVWLAGLAHYRRGKPQRWSKRGTADIIDWRARGRRRRCPGWEFAASAAVGETTSTMACPRLYSVLRAY